MIQESNLIEIISKKTGASKKEVKNNVDTIFKLIKDNISEDELVKVNNFGTFKVKKVATKTQIDVNTGLRITVPSHNLVTFRPLFVINNKGESVFIEEESSVQYHEDGNNEEVVVPTTGKLVFQYDGVDFNEVQISEILLAKSGLSKIQVDGTIADLKGLMIETGHTRCIVTETDNEFGFDFE